MYFVLLSQGLGPLQFLMQEYCTALQNELALMWKVLHSVAEGHPGLSPLHSDLYLLQLKACIHTQHTAGSRS